MPRISFAFFPYWVANVLTLAARSWCESLEEENVRTDRMEGEIPFNPSIRLGRFSCALAPSALRDVVRLFCPDAEQIEARRLLAASAADVLTYHNDSARTYQDLDKTILNP